MNLFTIDLNHLMISSLGDWSRCQPLLAAASKGPSTIAIALGLVIAVTIAAIACGWHFLRRLRRGRVDDSKAIFRELCRAHDLQNFQVRLLKRLATGLELPCPSALFIDSSLWRLPDGSDRGKRLSKSDWEKLMRIQRTLFLPLLLKPAP
jgi:hypothetical protein